MREQDTLSTDDRRDEALQGIPTGQKSTLSKVQYGGKVGFKEKSWVSAYAVNHITPPLTITEEKLLFSSILWKANKLQKSEVLFQESPRILLLL